MLVQSFAQCFRCLCQARGRPPATSMTAHPRLPVLFMPKVLNDPVISLMHEQPSEVIHQRAIKFLHSCYFCLAPGPLTQAGADAAGVSEPTLLFHSSNRQPPCGAVDARGHVYWASRTAALYAQKHACEQCCVATASAIAIGPPAQPCAQMSMLLLTRLFPWLRWFRRRHRSRRCQYTFHSPS